MAKKSGASWRAATSTPLLILSLAFTLTFALPIYFPGIPGWLKTSMEVANWIIWIVFIVDFAVQLVTAESRWTFLRRYWWIAVLAAIPFFRPVRAVATLMLAQQAGRRSRHHLSISLPLMAIMVAGILTIVLGAATLDAERGFPGSNITTAGIAFWWALGSVTSINTGEHYPVSNLGHAIGDLLGLVGIVLAGVFTASLGAWLVGEQNRFGGDRDEWDDSASGSSSSSVSPSVAPIAGESK